jgi:hypothetical protein
VFQIRKTYIMKMPLLLCALVLSIQGWCAAVVPSQRATHEITHGHQTIGGDMFQEETSSPLLVDKMKTALIGWVLITFLTAIICWAVTAKNSLDKILKDVLQDMAQYS